jgi:hypothetical protein
MGDDERSVFNSGGTAIVIHAVAGGTGSGLRRSPAASSQVAKI